ncbi:VCBS repeat-containing protein [Jiulongibacter sediminis]|uniref:RNA-binding protein n=1 Tax=Jiulongibacter sediminis TaxID=1605367 RepID=A0A0P7BCC6_9BACT|nr:VCBS repeat-containing protein [Jiulongibacter sediminis]KPM48219.1 RNA-binding protein [Jiulongibacter sediminis]TBX24762.1 RNA-binding protein [Jiulongibacter sediminis]
MQKLFPAILVFTLLLVSCKEDNNDSLFRLMTADETGINFSNDIRNTETFNIFNYRNFYNGGGVAAGDINNDGLTDLLFTANMGSNKLYLNKGNFQFEDITEKAGIAEADKWSTGVVMVDINYDGLLDIYICNAGYQKGVSTENALFINNGNLTFTEKASEYGLNDDGYTTHTAFFDYDKDGDLDAYILNNSFIPVNTLNYANNREMRAKDWPVRDFLKGGGDKLLRNDDGQFVDVSEEAGIYGSLIGFGLGITVGDVNNDNWPDMYVSNDFFEKDYLYINQKDGTFKEELEDRIQHTSLASMGADMADINNDGQPEIFVTDMLPQTEQRLKTTASYENHYIYNLKQERGFYHQFMQNSLQLNNGNGDFSEIAQFSGVAKSDWSWGALMFDADNDGLTDIYVSNGIRHDVIDQDFIDFFADELSQKMAISGKKESIEKILEKMPSVPVVNSFFKNTGNLKFEFESEQVGFKEESFSNGAVYADLDNDGDLDLVVNNVNQTCFVYENQSKKDNHFLKIKLKGENKNPRAIGAKVLVYQKGKVFSQQMIPTRGFQSSTDYALNFGLGGDSEIDSLQVIWPNDQMSFSGLFYADTTLIFDIKNANKKWSPEKTDGRPILVEKENRFDPHLENEYSDYYNEKNIAFKLSTEGPKAAVGDINGDGKNDVIIAGAKDQVTKVYLSSNGSFQTLDQPAFERFISFEDTAIELFDADGDGDLDVYLGSGGNEVSQGNRELMDRLFMNDGKGNFEIKTGGLPNISLNTSVVKANDFDKDGDLDLFVGSRNMPLQYGLFPNSYLLKNDGKGKFSIQQTFLTLGMVTEAAWADLDGDKSSELIITGEWMETMVFANQDGQFVAKNNTGLVNLKGFWSALNITDIDNDGDPDLLLGNMGENFSFEVDSDKPFKVWVADFDHNNTIDKVFSKTIDGEDKPVFLKRDITDQFPSLKNASLKHADYASKTIQDLFEKNSIEQSIVKEVNYLKSIVARNNGDGSFSVEEMPIEIQFSCVNDIISHDVNKDGFNDLILAGNNTHMIPQFGTLDACRGNVLLNTGGKGFQTAKNSGLNLKGNVRQLSLLNDDLLLVLINNQKPKTYQLP